MGEFTVLGETRIVSTADGVTLLYDGDLVIQSALTGVNRVQVTGNLVLRADLPEVEFTAMKTLVAEGGASARALRAPRVLLRHGTVTARLVHSSEALQVEDAHLEVDVMVGPKVRLGLGSRGRVTVLQSRADVEKGALRGCLSFEDYETMFGEVRGFLTAHGVTLGDVDACLPAAYPPGRVEAPPTTAPRGARYVSPGTNSLFGDNEDPFHIELGDDAWTEEVGNESPLVFTD